MAYDDDDETPPGIDENGDELEEDGLDDDAGDDPDAAGTDDDIDARGDTPPEDLEDDDEPALPPDPPGTERNKAGRLVDSRTKQLVSDPRRSKPGTPGVQPQADRGEGADDEPVEGEEPPPAAPVIPDDAVPFAFTADRQQYHIPGSYQTDDGSFVFTPAAVATLNRIAAAGQHSIAEGGKEVRQLREKIQELTAGRSARETALEAAHAELALIMRDPAKLMEFADDLQRNWDLLQERHRAKALEDENKRLREAPNRQRDEASDEEREEYRTSQLEKAIYDRVNQRYADVGFTIEDLVPAYRLLHKAGAIRQADQPIKNDGGQVVINKGQWYVDWDLVDSVLEDRKAIKGTTKTVATAARRAAEINGRRNGVRTPPPAAGRGSRTEGRGGEPDRPRRAPRLPQSREEADALLSMPADEANKRIGYDPTRRPR